MGERPSFLQQSALMARDNGSRVSYKNAPSERGHLCQGDAHDVQVVGGRLLFIRSRQGDFARSKIEAKEERRVGQGRESERGRDLVEEPVSPFFFVSKIRLENLILEIVGSRR